MASPVHQLHLEADEMPRLRVSEFTSTAHGTVDFCVNLEIDSDPTTFLKVFCRTADQVRAFIPAFVSKAEQAALDAEDKNPGCDHCGEVVHRADNGRWKHDDGYYCEGTASAAPVAEVNGSIFVPAEASA